MKLILILFGILALSTLPVVAGLLTPTTGTGCQLFSSRGGGGGSSIGCARSKHCCNMNQSEEQASKLAEEWISAWNNHDMDSLLTHFDDDVTFTSPYIASITGAPSGTLIGKQSAKDYFLTVLKKYPDLKYSLLQSLPGIDTVALYYQSVKDLTACEVIFLNHKQKATNVLKHYKSSDEAAATDAGYQKAVTLATEWISAWNNRDMDAIMVIFDKDVEFSSPLIAAVTEEGSGTLYGTEDLQNYFSAALVKYPDIHMELLDVLVGKNTIAVYFRSVSNMLVCEILYLNEDGKVHKVLNHYKSPDGGATAIEEK